MIKKFLLFTFLFFCFFTTSKASVIKSGEIFTFTLPSKEFSYLPVRGVSSEDIKALADNNSLEFYVLKRSDNLEASIFYTLSSNVENKFNLQGALNDGYLKSIDLSTFSLNNENTLVVYNSGDEDEATLSISKSFNPTYFPLRKGHNLVSSFDTDFFEKIKENKDILYLGCVNNDSNPEDGSILKDHLNIDLHINYTLGSSVYNTQSGNYFHKSSVNNDGETGIALDMLDDCKTGYSGRYLYIYAIRPTVLGDKNFDNGIPGIDYNLYGFEGTGLKNKIPLSTDLGEACLESDFNKTKTLSSGKIGICLYKGDYEWKNIETAWMNDTLQKCNEDLSRKNCEQIDSYTLKYDLITPLFSYYDTGTSVKTNSDISSSYNKNNSYIVTDKNDCTDTSMLGVKLSSDYKCRKSGVFKTLMNSDLTQCYNGQMPTVPTSWYDLGEILTVSKTTFKCTELGWKELCSGELDEDGVYEGGYTKITIPSDSLFGDNYKLCVPFNNSFVGDINVKNPKEPEPGYKFINKKFDHEGSLSWNDKYSLCYAEGGTFNGQLSEKIGDKRNVYAYFCKIQVESDDNLDIDSFCGLGTKQYYGYTSNEGIGKPYCSFGDNKATNMKIAEYSESILASGFPKVYLSYSGSSVTRLTISNGNAEGFEEKVRNVENEEIVGNICNNFGGSSDHLWLYKPNGTTVGAGCKLEDTEKLRKVKYVFDMYDDFFARKPNVDMKLYFEAEPSTSSSLENDEMASLLSYEKDLIRKIIIIRRFDYLCDNHISSDYYDISCTSDDIFNIILSIDDFSEILTKEDVYTMYDDYFDQLVLDKKQKEKEEKEKKEKEEEDKKIVNKAGSTTVTLTPIGN